MSKDDHVNERRAFRWWPTSGIAFATPVLVWFSIGPQRRWGPNWLYGPYNVGPESGFVIAGPAALIAALSLVVLVMRTRRGVVGRSWAVSAPLVAAGAVGAATWRLATSGYSGADIFGWLVLLLAPIFIVGLLIGAILIAGAFERWTRRRIWFLSGAAVLVAPAIFAVMGVLSSYDSSRGVATSREYDAVRIGQTRAQVHNIVGREDLTRLPNIDFPPSPPGLLCDYYETDKGSAQFCFRSGTLISKDLSSKIYGS